jgi:hypothetical protein
MRESVHRPIFIGGLSFTGKTQLRAMLSAHPNILITRRTHLWDRFYKRYGDLNHSVNLERCLRAMLASKPIHALHLDVDHLKHELVKGTVTYERLFAVILAQYAAQEGKSRWGDQLTFIEYYADSIFAAYPSARVIHMLRDPGSRAGENASTSSHRVGWVGWETAWWLSSARLAKHHQERYPDRYLVIRYEQLFTQHEETLRNVCAFLDEPFYPEMLGRGQIESHLPEQQTPLPIRDLYFIRSFAQQLMETFGYDFNHGRLSFRDSLLYILGWPMNLAGLLVGMAGAGLGERQFFHKEILG